LESDILEDNFYSMKNYFINLFDENYRSLGFFGSSKEELVLWQSDMRVKLSHILGFDKMKKSQLNPKIVENVRLDGYNRSKVIIQTQPNVFMPMFVLVPDKKRNVPVIAIHGHSSDGKNGLVGIVNELTEKKIKDYNYTYALDLVKRGYTVFCPDLCGSGERREKKQRKLSSVLESSCNDVNNAALSLGMSILGIMVFDLIRIIDYIQTLDFGGNIACCGFSGGGLCALWLAAIDERISCAAVSGYFHGLRDTILENNFCGCNFVADLWRFIDICDLGSMIAPRPLLIESGRNDKLNGERGLQNVFEQVSETQKAYDLFQSDSLFHKIFDGGHKWYGSAYDFIENWSDSLE